MATDLLVVDPEQPDPNTIDRACSAVRRGAIVALPTGALYSLVADPLNLHAVGRVFAAKGREVQWALPLLVSDVLMAEELAKDISPRFYLLARRFWPGPLTIIVSASSRVPLKVTGNTGRLALRQPRSKIAQAMLDKLGQPLIATSANLSGMPTCSSGIEVFGVMDGRVDLVLDGGLASGAGATTVDITEPYWRVIKEGSITEREIAEVLRGT